MRSTAFSCSAGTSTAAPGWSAKATRRTTGCRQRSSEFLTELVRRRPELQVHLLLWDYSMLYAGERELFPRLSLQWGAPEQIKLCLDNIVPFGCSQHQKIIVVDNAVAFSGGLDLTIRRWDTTEHKAHNPGPRRSVRHAVQALSRRPDGGGRRCGARACRDCLRTLGEGGGMPEPVIRSAGRSMAGRRHPGLHRRGHRHRAHPALLRRPGRGARGRGTVPRFHRRRASIRSTSRTSLSPLTPIARRAGQAAARAKAARSADRRAASSRILGRGENHAQRAHPFLAHGAQGRRRPRAVDVSRCRGRRRKAHKP